tara:strand:+ start:591 stop:1196 length:606 start_codon:yes stop_codon:yes gene_type:complete
MARNAQITTPTTLKIVTLVEAKEHLRILHADDDNYITNLISVAQENINNYCNTLILETSVKQSGNNFQEISQLLFSPIKNTGSIQNFVLKYLDSAGATQTLIASDYTLNKFISPPQITLNDGVTFPEFLKNANSVFCEYDCGETNATDVPLALKQAALILIGQFYENRQVDVVGRSVGTIPMSAQYLMNPYRVETLGQLAC